MKTFYSYIDEDSLEEISLPDLQAKISGDTKSRGDRKKKMEKLRKELEKIKKNIEPKYKMGRG